MSSYLVAQRGNHLAGGVNTAFNRSMDRRNVAGLAAHTNRLAREEQRVRHRQAKHLPRIVVRLVRGCGVAAPTERIGMPHPPFGTHEQVPNPWQRATVRPEDYNRIRYLLRIAIHVHFRDFRRQFSQKLR